MDNMDSYLLNLVGNNTGSCELNWDATQFGCPPEQFPGQQSVAETTPPMKASKKSRNKNFSEKEDILLCKTWLEISQDAVQGSEQPKSTYWKRIHDHYNAHKEAMLPDRNESSLSHRWGIIQLSVSKFCGCYTQIQNRNQSGVSEHDKVQDARDLYKGNDQHHRVFVLLHCWNILQHAPKWCGLLASFENKKQNITSGASPSVCTPGSGQSHHGDEEDGLTHTSPRKPRPMGRKKAKLLQGNSTSGEPLYVDAMENLRKAREKADELKEIKKKERNDARLEVEKARLEQKRESDNRKLQIMEKELEHKQNIEDERVMGQDLSGMSEPQLTFYKEWQQEIIVRRFGRRQVEK